MKQKKLILILTALTLACAMLLTACDKLTVKSVQKDPFETVCNSVEKTAEACFAKYASAKNMLEWLDGGRVSLALQADGTVVNADVIVGEDMTKIDAQVKPEGMDALQLSLFSNASEVILSSDTLLGGSYGVNLTTLREDLKDSALLSAFGVDYDTLMEQLDSLLDQSSKNSEILKNLETYQKNMEDAFKRIFGAAEMTVGEETLSLGGKDVKAITVSMKINFDMLCDYLASLLDETETFLKPVLSSDESNGLGSSFKESRSSLEQMRKDTQMNGILSFALNPKTEQVMVVTFDGVGSTDGGEEQPAKFTLTLGETPADSEAFVLDYYAKDSETTEEGTLTLSRVDNDGEFARRLTLLDKTEGGEAKEVLSYTRNKQDKTYIFQIGDSFSASGTFSTEGTSTKITVDKLSVDGTTMDGYTLSLTFNGENETLTKPEYKNLATLSEAELKALIETVMKNATPLLPVLGVGSDSNGTQETVADDAAILLEFDESVDYNNDGTVGDDADHTYWLEHYNIIVVYSAEVDYNGDGIVGDAADKTAFESLRAMYIFNDAYDYDADGDVDEDDKFIFDNYLAGFNEEMDYDGDGDSGDNDDYLTWQTTVYGEPIE